jgi:hypothetical protein
MNEFRLFRELAAIASAEREAARRQTKVGIVPVKTSFRTDLSPELDAALDRLWAAGSSLGQGRVDRVLKLCTSRPIGALRASARRT